MAKKKEELSRRDFGRRSTFALVGSALVSQVEGVPAAEASPFQRADAADIPEDIRAEVESKYSHLIAKYGDRLNEDQRQRAREVLQRHVRMLESVRKVTLENGDPPASVLKVLTS